MPGYYKTEAIVLRSMRLREADRIVHMYTGTRGKVGAVVKGVRRTKSRFGGRLEPFSRVSLVMYEGRGDLDTVTQATCVEWYPRLREHGGAIYYAGAACESVLRLFGEGEGNEAAYNLLCHELQLLDSRPEAAGGANLLAFRMKLMLAAGFVPELADCARCGGPAGGRLAALLRRRGRSDLPRLRGGRRLHAGRARALVHGGGAGRTPEGAPAATGPTLTQVERALSGTVEYHAHVRLRSVA